MTKSFSRCLKSLFFSQYTVFPYKFHNFIRFLKGSINAASMVRYNFFNQIRRTAVIIKLLFYLYLSVVSDFQYDKIGTLPRISISCCHKIFFSHPKSAFYFHNYFYFNRNIMIWKIPRSHHSSCMIPSLFKYICNRI